MVCIHVIYHVHVTCRQGTLGDRDGIALQGRSEKHTPFYSYYEYSQDTDKYTFINKFAWVCVPTFMCFVEKDSSSDYMAQEFCYLIFLNYVTHQLFLNHLKIN